MIISASYRTDIPTFYGDWFINRLRAGYCKTVNPYNKRISRLSLREEDVDGIVFWTKNVGPFLKHLQEVHDRRIPFVVQHTVNSYPRELEQSVVDPDKSIDHLKWIADRFGQRVNVWRYDTIVSSSITTRESHLDAFSRLASQLEGVTDEVVISFAHLYKKTLRNMDAAAIQNGFEWCDPDAEWKKALVADLVSIASAHKMQLTLCSQPNFLVQGSKEASCVDAQRLEAVSGKHIKANVKGNRPECQCYESRDIGDYDTCPHGCVYCYAVRNRQLAQQRYRQHDPQSEFLFEPPSDATESDNSNNIQQTLFGDE